MPVAEAPLLTRFRVRSVDPPLQFGFRVLQAQPDIEVDGDGEPILDGDGGFITLGEWDSTGLVVRFSVDGSILESAMPKPGPAQYVDIAVLIDGVRLDPSYLVGELSVDDQLEGPTTWSFAVPYSIRDAIEPLRRVRPLGSPLAAQGPPMGTADISIEGRYLARDGGHASWPLMTGGLATEAVLTQRGNETLLVIRGEGAEARYDRRTTTLILPPGHGMPREVVLRRIMNSIDARAPARLGGALNFVPFFDSRRMYKGLQAIEENALTLARDVADADNRVLGWDIRANPRTWPQVDDAGPIHWRFTAEDLCALQDVEIPCRADTPTRILITGTRQITRSSTDGTRTIESVAESFDVDPPQTATAVQAGSGAVTGTGFATPAAVLHLVGRTTSRSTLQGDTEIASELIVEAMKNPQVPRYRPELNADGVDGGGDYASYTAPAYLVDAGAAANDGTLAYRWPQERLSEVSRENVANGYDDRGYLTKVVESKSGWHWREFAIKSRATASVAWDSRPYLNVPLLGNGRGTDADGEVYLTPGSHGTTYGGRAPHLIERSTLTNRVDAKGFITRRKTVKEGWRAKEGRTYLYADGTERGESADSFRIFETIEVDYLEKNEGEILEVTTTRGMGGRILRVEKKPIDGFRPRAEQFADLVPDASIYEGDPDHADFALAASRTETQPIKHLLESRSLEDGGIKVRQDIREEHQLAEDEQDLEERSIVTQKLYGARTITFGLIGNFLIQKAQRAVLELPEMDLSDVVHVTGVRNGRAAAGAPCLQTVTGRIY